MVIDDLASLASFPSLPDSGYESLDDAELRDGADELASMLLDDGRLQELFAVAFKRVRAQERFVLKFRMLLKAFGIGLKKEAHNISHEAAAELAQAKANYVAHKIREEYRLEDEYRGESDDARSGRVERLISNHLSLTRVEPADPNSEAMHRSDSENSFEDESGADFQPRRDKMSQISLEDLKTFIKSSQAFTQLQNAFRRMVYLDLCIAIRDTVCGAYGLGQGTIKGTFDVRWEIAQYLRSELGYVTALQQRSDSLQSVLTISGTANKPYAARAADYMRWKWPRSNFKLLEIIEDMLKGRIARKIKASLNV